MGAPFAIWTGGGSTKPNDEAARPVPPGVLHVHGPPEMTGGGRLVSGESVGWGAVQGRVSADAALLSVMGPRVLGSHPPPRTAPMTPDAGVMVHGCAGKLAVPMK